MSQTTLPVEKETTKKQSSVKLNENKIPDFKFTPPPPPKTQKTAETKKQ